MIYPRVIANDNDLIDLLRAVLEETQAHEEELTDREKENEEEIIAKNSEIDSYLDDINTLEAENENLKEELRMIKEQHLKKPFRVVKLGVK